MEDEMINDALQTMTGVLNSVDSFNVQAGAMKESIKSGIVTGSLNALNSGFSGGGGSSLQSAMSASYDFNKSVLSAGYENKGLFLDTRSSMGSSMQSALSANYDFNKSVLSAGYDTRGIFLNI
jgi:hypothetical protein